MLWQGNPCRAGVELSMQLPLTQDWSRMSKHHCAMAQTCGGGSEPNAQSPACPHRCTTDATVERRCRGPVLLCRGATGGVHVTLTEYQHLCAAGHVGGAPDELLCAPDPYGPQPCLRGRLPGSARGVPEARPRRRARQRARVRPPAPPLTLSGQGICSGSY